MLAFELAQRQACACSTLLACATCVYKCMCERAFAFACACASAHVALHVEFGSNIDLIVKRISKAMTTYGVFIRFFFCLRGTKGGTSLAACLIGPLLSLEPSSPLNGHTCPFFGIPHNGHLRTEAHVQSQHCSKDSLRAYLYGSRIAGAEA